MQEKIILFITPQTWVRSGKNDGWLFRIPEEELIEKYDPRHLKRKRRLEKYNDYKRQLRKEAEAINFKFPDSGAWVRFFYPMPPSWGKKKRARMSFKPHQSKPDSSNLYKALEDALRSDDMKVWDHHATKYWYDSPIQKGFIEILILDDRLSWDQIDKIPVRKIQDGTIK